MLERKGALRRISVENRVDISGGEDGLVAVAVEAVVGVSSAGHDAAAVVVAGNTAVVVAGFACATPPQEGIVRETPKSTQPSPKAKLQPDSEDEEAPT